MNNTDKEEETIISSDDKRQAVLDRKASEFNQEKSEIDILKDALLRSMAEFDNYRKRTIKSIEEARLAGRDSMLRALLPVFDSIERAIDIETHNINFDQEAIYNEGGLTSILKQFNSVLAKENIMRVSTACEKFNPAIHEAIQTVETDKYAPGTIVDEMRTGYISGDRLLRAALVSVAK